MYYMYKKFQLKICRCFQFILKLKIRGPIYFSFLFPSDLDQLFCSDRYRLVIGLDYIYVSTSAQSTAFEAKSEDYTYI